jgi:hypothetical protein
MGEFRVGRGLAVAGSVEDPERTGPLFRDPRGPGFAADGSGTSCCAASFEEPALAEGLTAGPRHPRTGFDEPSSFPLPARLAEPDRAGASVLGAEEPRGVGSPRLALLLPRGVFASPREGGR